jgi:hypothetical protein
MNKQFFLYIFILFFGLSQAQEKLSKEEKARRERNIQAGNPFVKYGSKAPVATLSKGKYLEVHDLDSIVTIGTMRWHVDNKKIVGHIVRDTLNPDAQPIGDSPGMWMSPDPLSEEFPDKSPYAFANNNPLRFTDPTGMAPEDIIIMNGKQQLKYVNGNLSNKDGSNYTGKLDRFAQKTVTALGEISKSAEGAAMINELQSSKNTFTISEGKSEFNESRETKVKAYANAFATDPAYANSFQTLQSQGVDFTGGSGGAITWNKSGGVIPTTLGLKTNASIDLAHEMFHALDANRGLLDDRKENGVKRSEWQAVYRENNVRSQLGLPLRNSYISEQDGETGAILRGLPPSMLNSSNQNSKPSWYK